MTVSELRRTAEKTRANIDALRAQLAQLEQTEIDDDLISAVNQQAAIRTARELLVERQQLLEQQIHAAEEAEAEEERQRAIAALRKHSEKAFERYNDSIAAVTGSLAEVNACNEESIKLRQGALFIAVGAVKLPPRLVKNTDGLTYRIGAI